MTKILSVLVPAADASELVQQLRGMTGVESSDPTDWGSGSTAFDAPFNIRRRDRAFRLVRILIHDDRVAGPLSAAIAGVPEVHVLDDPGTEPVEVGSPGDVDEAIRHAPTLG